MGEPDRMQDLFRGDGQSPLDVSLLEVLHEGHYFGGSCDGPGSKPPLSSGTRSGFSPPSNLYVVFVWVLWPPSRRRYLGWGEDRLLAGMERPPSPHTCPALQFI